MSSFTPLPGRLDPGSSDYLRALSERVVIFDGATGTNLQLLDLTADDFGGPDLEGCNEMLVDTRPDAIEQLHRSFLDVGVDVIETDSFGSSSGGAGRVRPGRSGPRAQPRRRPGWPAGWPTSTPPPPGPAGWPAAWARARSSRRSARSATTSLRDAYEEQALGLLEGGVDLLVVETMFDLLAAKAAIDGARRAMARRGRGYRSRCRSRSSSPGGCCPGTEIGAALTALGRHAAST